MTLTITHVDGNPVTTLLGITVDGKPRVWRRPLHVVLEITPVASAADPRGEATTALYALSVPVLGIEVRAQRSIVEAVRRLQEEIAASLPRDVLEALLVPPTLNTAS